jgi:hypothetical protein
LAVTCQWPSTFDFCKTMRRHGMRALATQPAGAPVPLHHSTIGRHEAIIGRSAGQSGVPLQAPISGWVDSCGAGANGFHGQTGGPRAQTEAEPHSFSRGLRAQLSAPKTDSSSPSKGPRGQRQAAGADVLDATPQAGIRHRSRNLPGLRGAAAGDRLCRGACPNREDSGAHSDPR